MPNKKICLIIPSLRHGGAERVISVLANEWAKNIDLEIYLILLTKQEHFYSIDKRVKIIEPSKYYRSNPIDKAFYSLWTLYFIRKNIKNIRPDSILSFCERYNNIVLLSLLGTKTSVFVSDRNNPKRNLGIIHENLRKKLYRKAAGIIAQTDTANQILLAKTDNKNIKTIPNPIRYIENFPDVQKENIIINIGRFESQKNQKDLIEIFSKLKLDDSWKLMLIGVGSLKSNLLQQVGEKGLTNRTIILDFQSDIDKYFQKAKIFAFTSINEGFPNALLEAMANGLACISYDCPTGPSELIVDEVNGNLIPLYDIDLFQQKLQELVDNENKQLNFGKIAQKSKYKYSTATISKLYLNFILNEVDN
ncbi:glycosyltransferase [Sphingobacterium thalpophilum]|uniref:glycosyltransferase n=1 Tax=Sphingobacterium thalpophilum TaxID=259 RepID=UPI0037DA59FF